MMSTQNKRTLLVFGNTLAASMTTLALSKALPESIELIWVKPSETCLSDELYGGITTPAAYQFNLKNGVTEPDLILNTDTTFTFGSRFQDWGNNNRSWMQCFHLPFAATSGVELHHFMTRHKANLGDFLISAQAGIKGTFAHPPTDNVKSPLSRAEYGYHFDPAQWGSLFSRKIDNTRVSILHDELSLKGNAVLLTDAKDCIKSLKLSDGTLLKADLYIDCSGTSSQLLSTLNADFVCQREVQLSTEVKACEQTGPANRAIKGTDYGWQATIPLRHKHHVVSLFESAFTTNEANRQSVKLGYRNDAWQGNCVGIGHSAYALEPITPAPYTLLLKDIERLLELIPVSADTLMERQQYNRRYQDDMSHAVLFHHALYAGQRDVGYSECAKLDRKLSQYLHRGILASFDFEPFNEQDWAILHAGLGRMPEHYDRMAEQVDFEKMQANLDSVRAGIAHLASKMPAHHTYLEKLTMYLKENQKHG
jgi:tryptophan halogenase